MVFPSFEIFATGIPFSLKISMLEFPMNFRSFRGFKNSLWTLNRRLVEKSEHSSMSKNDI